MHNHPHIVYLTCLSLFFGPVIILVPFLLLHEIAILLLFNLGFVTHGLIPGELVPHSLHHAHIVNINQPERAHQAY